MLVTLPLVAALAALAPAVSANSAIQEYKLSAPGIRASFIPHGARLLTLEVPDRNGEWRDVNLAHAETKTFAEETSSSRSYFGSVVGRYANRIRNGTFYVDGQDYHTPLNDHDGLDTLHGGLEAYDAREWTVLSSNASTITFQLLDHASEGFPGNVLALASYTVTAGKLTTILTAYALDLPTPILLTTHSFFNLAGDATTTVLDDTLELPGAGRYVMVDSIAVPTGEIADLRSVRPDGSLHPLNYTSARPIRDSLDANLCGDGCVGLDNCWIFDKPEPVDGPSVGPAQVIWTSEQSGIRMKVHTNQPAIQLYDCIGMDGTLATSAGTVVKYGCMAIEPQGWIDGINHPEWNQRQIYAPGQGPHVNIAEYAFDTVPIAQHPDLDAALGMGSQGFLHV